MRYRITQDTVGQYFLEGTVCGADAPYEDGMWKQVVGPCKSEAQALEFYRMEKALEVNRARKTVWTEPQ